MNSIHRILAENNPLIELVVNGIKWNKETKEFDISYNGEVIAWASDCKTAERSYFEILRVDREHRQRNPANAIPFDGRPGDSGDESSEDARLGLPVEW